MCDGEYGKDECEETMGEMTVATVGVPVADVGETEAKGGERSELSATKPLAT